MLSVGFWSDFRYGVKFEIFKNEDRIVCRNMRPLASASSIGERELVGTVFPLINRGVRTPVIIDAALTIQKLFDTLATKGFEINSEGEISLLPYDICYPWVVTADQIVTLYQAETADHPHQLMWQFVDHEKKMLSRIPVDEALTRDIQACRNPKERTIYLKDRRIAQMLYADSNLQSISLEQIRSKLDSSKVLTSENWAVTVVISVAPDFSSMDLMRRAGHASIIIEKVQALSHQILRTHLRAEGVGLDGFGRARVCLDEIGCERF